MASNLSTIGFTFIDEDSFRTTMMGCATESTVRLACGAGTYGIWRARSGAEVWFHLTNAENGSTEIVGLTPFFEGQSEVLLKITESVSRNDDNPFEGALKGWVSPDDGSDGSYPIQFEAVDFAASNTNTWPDLRHVRLTAFARELQAFPSDEAYYAARGEPNSEVPKLAAHAYIPIGLFAADVDGADDASNQPQSESSALLTGKIIEHRVLTNDTTGQEFVWLLVESLEATFDIVADPAIVTGELIDGGTIEAAVVMFGRLLENAEPDAAA